MSESPTIVWLRQDLRLADHPALAAAAARGGAVVPVYIWDEAGEGDWPLGGASRWWLHHSLAALDDALQGKGSRLVLRAGRAIEVLRALMAETGATAVYWSRRYEPGSIKRDREVKAALREDGAEVRSFNSALLHEPHTIRNKQGGPFKVFTPFWRHCLAREKEAVTPDLPATLRSPQTWPTCDDLSAWKLLPRRDWADGFSERWRPGENGAHEALAAFADEVINQYSDQRNFPGIRGTSRLSPYLHFGEISPRQIWAAVAALGAERGVFPASKGAQVFLAEVGWREFAYHLLFHFDHTPTHPLRDEFAAFPWRADEDGTLLRAWQNGRTGYPIVDAGMRELWATGWMHNRVRMVVASFLVKHLRLPWQRGAEWFWDTLVDADLASNTLGWQWSAGCGADAAPYFRVFAPVLQGGKFDGDGDYVRRWVPELASLPNKHLHAPWEAPEQVLTAAGVALGRNYPHPIVDHKEARDAALAAYQELRQGGRP
ncbi:cryptochrome/photolyase family protein [Synoicihabitans lomoniglobus]|uniref:Deoxyribodipyrimidine photo-lyase n=1 Tax=Synoicihabitans lomoniglobus TaxID=2909285 RepID=A0AAF0I5I0_9BACT|nr:DNA photolyase family protein [Opitutaceae bacterium LMO-M01]WED67289.1 deoxyribodipyrimidine photo-lyase [Opitutaceae bacterium LMO-M01]